MQVRFGYVAMSVIVQNASPSKTMTATNFSKLQDREAAIRKLERIAEENIHNTLRLLRHNRAHGIEVFRFSSRLIPLIGHELLAGWDPYPVLAGPFAELGAYVREHGMRVSFHPDHFTVLSTPRKEVLDSSIADLNRHVRMLEAMGLDTRAKSNIHIGGTYGNKPSARERFVRHFGLLGDEVRQRLTLENDDKTFNAAETLSVCEEVGVPMVLDVHHHAVNNDGESAESLWPRIAATWDGPNGSGLAPKIHVSSPKSEADPRGHADYVEAGPLHHFLQSIAASTPRLDVMIEAKRKDDALMKLVEELSGLDGVKRSGEAAVELGG
ncbi:UV DNA damage repair endonuclease UvsE [Paenibacillus sp. y28]|uniref:UV DNA damage repair endonuclease UvsE n=1 Tax=Paenibacillus sp. y28 TaxID=3129110 RepID=UPI003016E555